MNKKKYLSVIYAFCCRAFQRISTINIFAQKIETMKNEQPVKPCSGEKFVMPATIAAGSEAFADFIKIMSLPGGQRQKTFSDVSNQEKANVYRVKLALEFKRRPDLSKEQKSLILEAISAVSAETYNKDNPESVAKAEKQAEDFERRAASIFPPKEAFSIFEGISGDKTADIAFLKKYEEKLALPMNVRGKTIRETTSAEKSDFWKAQMIYHLATAKLSKAQFEFIVETIPLLTDNAFDFPKVSGQPENEETKAIKSLEPKIIELFSKEEAFAIFMGKGIHKVVPADSNLIPPGPLYCECRNWCGPDMLCGPPDCVRTGDGCGIWGGTPCLYVCIY